MLFEIERTTVAGRPALSVRGELDITTVSELAEAVESHLSQEHRSLVVDLTGTTFLDSSGARQLALITRRSAAAGVALEVVCPRDNRPVRTVVDLLELHSLVPIVESAGRSEDGARP